MNEVDFRSPKRATPWVQVDEEELAQLRTIKDAAAGLLAAKLLDAPLKPALRRAVEKLLSALQIRP